MKKKRDSRTAHSETCVRTAEKQKYFAKQTTKRKLKEQGEA